MKKKFEFLNFYVPKCSENVLTNTAVEAETKRCQIILDCRTIILQKMINSSISFGDRLQNQSLKYKFTFSPNVFTPPKISPQLLQQTSHLYSYIHQNVKNFLSTLLYAHSQSTSEFNFLVASSIPSLFGFFASQEHLNIAFNFYMKVISATNANLGILILSPFFSSPCLVRFLENVFIPFFDRFFCDVKTLSAKGSKKIYFLHIHALYLFGLIRKYFCLIPQTHICILNMMRSQWGIKPTSQFFVRNFLTPSAVEYLDSKEKRNRTDETVEIFSILLQVIKGNSSPIEDILNNISEIHSFYEPPEMYSSFDQPFLLFTASIFDVLTLSKWYSLYLKSIDKKVPPSLTEFNIDDTPHDSIFWFKIYPKLHFPVFDCRRPLIFDVDFLPKTLSTSKSLDISKLETQNNLNKQTKPNSPVDKSLSHHDLHQMMTEESEEEDISSPEFERIWLYIESEARDEGKQPYDFLYSARMDEIRSRLSPSFIHYFMKKVISRLNESAKAFETLIRYRSALHEIDMWKLIVETKLEMSSADAATNDVIKSWKKNSSLKKINEAFLKASEHYILHSTRKFQFFQLLEMNIKKDFSKELKKDLQQLNSYWNQLMIDQGNQKSIIPIGAFDDPSNQSNNLLSEVSLSFLFQREHGHFDKYHYEIFENEHLSLNQTFLEAVKKIRQADTDSLANAFQDYLCAAKHCLSITDELEFRSDVEISNSKKEIILRAILLAGSKDIIFKYLIIKIYAMSNRDFTDICSKSELFTWVKFEEQLLRAIMEDDTTRSFFLEVQESMKQLSCNP